MKLYFVRHGESEANLRNEFSNRGFKHGLTEKGRQQAQTLAQSIQSVPVVAVFSSPLLRACQTAEILAQTIGIPYQVTDALREFDCGVLEGKSDAESWQRYWQLSEAWLNRHEWEERIEQGESFLDIQQRFVPFVDQVLCTYQTSTGAIVLVGHGGTYRCMLPLILQNIDFAFSSKYGMSHTTTIIAEPSENGLVCRAWGEIVLGLTNEQG